MKTTIKIYPKTDYLNFNLPLFSSSLSNFHEHKGENVKSWKHGWVHKNIFTQSHKEGDLFEREQNLRGGKKRLQLVFYNILSGKHYTLFPIIAFHFIVQRKIVKGWISFSIKNRKTKTRSQFNWRSIQVDFFKILLSYFHLWLQLCRGLIFRYFMT